MTRIKKPDRNNADIRLEADVVTADTGSGSSALSIRAALPDIKTASSWTADIEFAPDLARNIQAMSLNSAKADLGELVGFVDRWHTVGLLLRPASLAGTLFLDGKLLLDGIPLVQGAWAGASPEIAVSTAGAAVVRVEDFEARYRDLVLKPQTAGDEVSQTLMRDSFEVYPAGAFPDQGGWRAPGAQAPETLKGAAEGALASSRMVSGKGETGRSGAPVQAGRTEAARQARYEGEVGVQAAVVGARAAVDDTDSVTGLQSLLIETDGTGDIIVAKRLNLPSRAPFGVSEGNFVIGVAKMASQMRTVSRSRLVEELGLGDRSDQAREKDDPVSGRKSELATEEQVPAIVNAGRTPSGSGDKTMKMMSASPVGNFYVYSFDGKLLQMYDVFGALLKDYIYMGDRLIAEYDHVGARFLYYTPDQINTTRVVTDQAGTVVYSAAHDPYGGIQQTWVSTYDPMLKFSGKERDAESGLDYFGARYYDKNQYRFISVDPSTSPNEALYHPQLFNLFSYCRNNPITFLDPGGNASFHFVIKVVYVPYGHDWVGINGWGRPEGGSLSISPSRASLDVTATAKIEILDKKSSLWYEPWRTATPLWVEFHERRHLASIEAYVQRRIDELEPLWTEKGYSEAEIRAEIQKLVDEGAKKTAKNLDSGWGAALGWVESWYYRFYVPFWVSFGTSADEKKH